ncbi:MAG: hypothetical protein ACRETL_00050 [Gammaproteobacteria bacterium]
MLKTVRYQSTCRITAGFHDAHAHPWADGVQRLKNVACDKASIDEILARLRARAAQTPRLLTRSDLDAGGARPSGDRGTPRWTYRLRQFTRSDASGRHRRGIALISKRYASCGDSMVRIGGIKQCADGSISEWTAWLAEPYVGIAGNYSGVKESTSESPCENSRKAWAASLQLATHANGERAVNRIRGVYEQLAREAPRRGVASAFR